jgi:type I restriction enzyme, S subunit
MSVPRYMKCKDCGVEWLSEVLEYFAPTEPKQLGKAQIGLTYDPTEIVEEGTGTLVLRSSNVQGGRIVFDDNVLVAKEIPSRLATRPIIAQEDL